MKLLSLAVEHFRCVRKAAIEFGPGLNVLHGPNDLGKSSLAMAIRAALLLQASSREHEEFVNWNGSGVPHVELTFESEPQRIWRVRKTFGSAAQSYLDESRDGVDFQLESRGREVDGRLSEILQWGLVPPGGKGRPKGMPMTFLSTALLAEQDRVSAIFDQALSQDSDESGKKRLIEALQAVAEDPLYKAVLARVQQRVDEAYTSNGGKRRGKNSPWAMISEQIRQKQDLERQCVEQLQRTSAIEAELRELHDREVERRSAVEVAQNALEAMEAYARDARLRDEVAGRLAEAKSRLAEIVAALEELGQAEDRRRALVLEVETLRKLAEDAHVAAVKAAERVLAAKEEVARQQSEDRARERQLKAASLEKSRAELRMEQAEVTATLERARGVQSAAQKVQSAEQEAAGAVDLATALAQRRQESALALRASDEREATLRAIGHLMRRRVAQEGVEKASAGLGQVRAWREEAARKRAAAANLETALDAVTLPSPALVNDLRQLDHQLQIARARLDVGLHVRIQPKRAVRVTLRRDGAEAAQHELKDSALEVGASREIRIELDKIAEITVAGGAQSAREEVERLQRRWLAEAEPSLERANAVNLEHLARLIADAAQRERDIQEERRAADQLDQRATDQPDWAAISTSQQKALAAAEAALKKADVAAAEALARKLRITDPAAADTRLEAHRAEREKMAEAVGKLDGELSAANARSAELQKAASVAREELVSAQSGLEGQWEELLARMAMRQSDLQRDLSAIEKALGSLAVAGDQELKVAAAALATAERDHEVADIAASRASEEHRAAERRAATADGEIQIRRQSAARLDEAAARSAVERAENELLQAPAPPQAVTPEMLEEARAVVEAARDELRRIEGDIQGKRGALEHVGGDVAKQRAAGAQEALAAARERERFLELEYAAWELLRTTLLEAEREEGVHLGRAIGDPIAKRFAELTNARYGRLDLGPDLETHAISVGGDGRAISALSVGTRDQLSTIFRLTLAEQLQSAVMLDDQLTQTDSDRMRWLGNLMREVAKNIQILVFTCRPADYLAAEELRPGRKAEPSKFVRAISLKQAIERSGVASEAAASN